MDKEEFKRQARCVATAWEVLEGQEGWDTVIKKFDLGFPYAWLDYMEHGTLNKKGQEQVTSTYAWMLTALGIPESEDYYNYWDMQQAFDNKTKQFCFIFMKKTFREEMVVGKTEDDLKVQLVSQAWLTLRDSEDEGIIKLLDYGDVAFPLSWAVRMDMAVLTAEGQEWVDEIYGLLIALLGIDKDIQYKSFDEMLEAHKVAREAVESSGGIW